MNQNPSVSNFHNLSSSRNISAFDTLTGERKVKEEQNDEEGDKTAVFGHSIKNI